MGLPDFLIIGAARCGTSSLFSNLLKHPRLRGPNLPLTRLKIEKECHFFDRKIRNPKFGLKWYKKCFRDPRADSIFFEATPNYLFVPNVPELVFECMPCAKFIVMLRDPVDRAWSHFYHWQKKAHWNESVLKMEDHEVVKKGIYWEQLERWFRFFNHKQFLIIRSEDFYRDEKTVILECFKFLGLSKHDFDRKTITYWDPARDYLISKRSYKKPSSDIVKWLRKFYAPHNARLEKLLNRKFGWG